MTFDKIQISSPKVPELVIDNLLNAIESGKLKINEDLPPERELAEELGISRSSLRESLAVLSFMGIVENRGNRKVVIKDAGYFRKARAFIHMSEKVDTFADFMEFRRANALEIVRLACRRATDADLERIRDTVERLERNASDYQADVDFHINLAYASHNMIFATMLDYINYMILDLRLRYFERSDYHGKTKEAHRRIYEAVKARDADRAAYEMDRHLSIIEDYYDNENADAEQKNS